MHAGTLEVDLHLPHCRSLKGKRATIRPIVDGARHRYRVAAAEVAEHDRWQRTRLGFAAVGSTPGHVADVLDQVERLVWSFPEVDVLGAERGWLERA